MIMTKQGIDVSKWMRVKKNLKWYCGNDGKRNLVIDLLKRFDGHPKKRRKPVKSDANKHFTQKRVRC